MKKKDWLRNIKFLTNNCAVGGCTIWKLFNYVRTYSFIIVRNDELGSYIINNYNNFNIGNFLFNSALGGLAGLVGGDGWTKAGSTLAYDLDFNGIKGSFMMLGRGALNEFSKPIIKSSIVGSAGFINDIFKKLR